MSRSPTGNKTRITITVDPALVKWVQEHIGPGKLFGSVSHAFESGIVALKEKARAKP